MLVQNVWSVAGSDSANDVNSFLLQTFANYNMEGGWYLNTSPVITADCEQDSGERWTVPLGLRIGRLLKNGKLPVDYRLAAYWNVEKLSFAPDWNLQFTVKLLFPKSLAKAPGACLTTIRSLVSTWALAAI